MIECRNKKSCRIFPSHYSMENESQNNAGMIVAVVALIAIVFITFVALRIIQAQPAVNSEEPIINLMLHGGGNNSSAQY